MDALRAERSFEQIPHARKQRRSAHEQDRVELRLVDLVLAVVQRGFGQRLQRLVEAALLQHLQELRALDLDPAAALQQKVAAVRHGRLVAEVLLDRLRLPQQMGRSASWCALSRSQPKSAIQLSIVSPP